MAGSNSTPEPQQPYVQPPPSASSAFPSATSLPNDLNTTSPPPFPLPPLPPLDSSLPPPILQTPRLTLRPMHPRDCPSMQLACSPPSITKYMTLAFAHPYTIAHCQAWITLNLTSHLPNYVFTLHSTPDTVIGGIGLKPGSDVHSHAAEVGYWLDEREWGRGYMSEMLEAFVGYVFENHAAREGEVSQGRPWGITRLWAGVFDGNEASVKCLLKSGFEREGCLKGHVEKKGEVMDLLIFGLRKGEWEQRQQRKLEGEGEGEEEEK